MQDEHQIEDDDMEESGGIKAWLEDNLRIILSILVVFAIAGGIYSYSQRSQAPAITEETVDEPGEEIAQGDTSSDSENSEDSKEAAGETTEDGASTEINPSEPEKTIAPATPQEPSAPTVAAESRETEGSFIETAVRGDGATHLARRALANYLEKNPDSAISREQKVYIEDYLRKNVSYGHVRVGTSLEFSKSLIQEAIGKSKQLNDRQLTNLKKYAERAPSLR